ncbi:PAS domain-containing protein [Chitinimonas lacunae]|uniref:PAS domain-containing protein n=1 Tax=Chitinimonas lacunae TaxID=1963018 RepID=A0ABV8MQY7_9NEIS
MSVRKYFPANPPLSDDQMLAGYKAGNAMLEGFGAVLFSLTLSRDRVLYLSPSASELYGETVELLRQHANFWHEVIHPEDKTEVWLGVERLREAAQGEAEFHYRLQRPDGELSWVRQHCRIALAEAGIPLRIDCLVVPSSPPPPPPQGHPGYEGLFLPAGDALLLRDPDTLRIVEANEAAAELLGYGQHELLRMTLHDCSALAQGFDGRAEQAIIEAARRGRPQRYEWQIEPREGRPRWVEIVLTHLQLGGRALLLSALRDIDQRKREEERQQMALDLIERGFSVIAQASPAGLLTRLNPTGRQWLGVSEEAVHDLFLTDLLPAWAQPHFLHTALPMATRDGVWRGEMVLMTREDRSLPVMLMLFAHKSDGTLKGYSLVAQDISAFKLREQRLKQSKEALEADVLLKDRMLDNISADLLPPLEQLRQLVQLLENRPDQIDLALPALRRHLNQARRLVDAATEFLANGPPGGDLRLP